MASAHIYPSTATRLAGEMNALAAHARAFDAGLPQLKEIMDQIAMGGDWASLATEMGYSSAADAETEYNLVGSLIVELADIAKSAAWQTFIARRG